MAVYLSMLRGINVSGQKMIKMPVLKAMYENMGFKNVTTYIQSGNVVFETKPDKNLARKIEQKIKETFSFDVPVIILTQEELKSVIAENPFLNKKDVQEDRLYVTFLQEAPSNELVEKIAQLDFTPEEFTVTGKAVYLYCPTGYGKTKLNNNFFENKLKVKATTRNWKTTNVLLGMMGNKS